jgi:Mrp family chromosome partitioning ATPase/capsular polysaccharide biosynthesis protein
VYVGGMTARTNWVLTACADEGSGHRLRYKGLSVAAEETSLSDILDTIRRRWRLIAMVTLSLVAGATFYAERQPLQYEASAIVAAIPRGDASADLVRVAAPRYASYITAAATVTRVAARLGEDPGQLQRRVNATIVPDTGNITITVRHTDPRRAQTAANALAAQLQRASAPDRQVKVLSVAPAVLPTSPSGPSRRLIEVAALVVGLLLGVGLAALVDATRHRPARSEWSGQPLAAGVAGTGQVAAIASPRAGPRLQMPASGAEQHKLGGYPVVCDLPWSPSLRASVADALADPGVDRAVRELTANLAQPLGSSLHGTIVVTSPSPHQGKTTVARLLAVSLHQSSARVLRVDGHKEHSEILRARKDSEKNRPPTAPGQGKYDESGLNWVRDLWALEDGMWVLPAARGPVAVALAEGRETEILSEAREMFDVIIVDGPPVLDEDAAPRASISRTLVPLADAVLFVISPDSTVDSLYRSIEELRDVGGPFVGVVLNRVREAAGSGDPSNVHPLRARPALGDAGGQ